MLRGLVWASMGLLALLALLALTGGCGDGAQATSATKLGGTAKTPAALEPSEAERAAAEEQKKLDAEFPLHGLVTGTQLKVRLKPDPEALTLGWLRIGSRVRLAKDPAKTPTCRSGFYRLHPQGFACAGEGIEVGSAPPQSVLAVSPPKKDDPLPYRYYFVKEPKVPEYHRLPSRDEQREVRDFLARYTELAVKNEDKGAALLRGELPGQPPPPTIVRRYLDRGFFVAGAGIEERASRQFVRAVRGSYAKLSQLEERHGSGFHGVELGQATGLSLPLAWAVREATGFSVRVRDDGTKRYVTDEASQTYPRQTLVPWAGRERVSGELLHKLQDGRYVKPWFLAVAETMPRPEGVGADEPWVHVEIGQQTIVLYRGDVPVYASLVSSGLEGHDTPLGLFTIRAKHVSASMSDVGPDAGDDRYSIDDVPWTQYFDGSIALHGAFWHDRFGLRRSHGCVNLAPLDAHRVFDHTGPKVPDGFHGMSTDKTGLAGSKVLVTFEGKIELPVAPVEGAEPAAAVPAAPKPVATQAPAEKKEAP
jgi:lipoprotein-anchoring transpeptidase ErfK/SrfK